MLSFPKFYYSEHSTEPRIIQDLGVNFMMEMTYISVINAPNRCYVSIPLGMINSFRYIEVSV